MHQVRSVAYTISRGIDMPWLPQALADVATPVFAPIYGPFENICVTLAPEVVTAMRRLALASTHSPAVAALPYLDPLMIIFTIICYFAALLALYVLGKFVFGKMELRAFSAVHNLCMVVVSLYMLILTVATALADHDSVINNPPVKAYTPMVTAIWVFMISKPMEFVDTFIMMLKHNYRQVTFLHVYHHSSILVVTYLMMLTGGGGDTYVSEILNSGVHVVMYAYYFGTGVFPKGSGVRGVLEAGKFMITKGQLTQFAINFMHATYMTFLLSAETRRYPVFPMAVLAVYMVTMLILFTNFLLKNQGDARKSAAKDRKVL